MKTMDNQLPDSNTGQAYAGTSLLFMILGWWTLHSSQEILQLIATIVAIGAGLFSIRHYYLLDKKKKVN